jgi:hypothetical protein
METGKGMTPAQQAFALLWRSSKKDSYAQKAYDILHASLSREERIEAVKWLMSDPFPEDFYQGGQSH